MGRWSDSSAIIFNIIKNKPKANLAAAGAIVMIPNEIAGSNGYANPYLDAAALGTAIGLGARFLYDSVDDAFTGDYTVTTTEDNPLMYVTLYRGVYSGHPDYANALKGMAVAPVLGPMGNMDPESHNSGNNLSVFTSWTLAPVVADFHANKHGNGGVVLKKRFRYDQVIPAPDNFAELEYLVPGTVVGAQVTFPNGPGSPNAY